MFSLSLSLSHENIDPLRHAGFRRDRLSEKLHGFDVSLGAVDVRASLTDQLRDGRPLWIQSREYAPPESSSCCTSSRHPRRFRKPARARSKLFPWLQLLRSVTLRPSIYKPTGCEICANCVETERFNRWEIRRSNWSVSVLLYCRWRTREPLCARAKSSLPLFEFIDHFYSRVCW